jgi:5-methylthioribose kinase
VVDASAGNLLTAPSSLFLIDWEFATVGPLAFDLGSLLGNLMLAVLSLKGMCEVEQQQQQQQQQEQQEQQQQQQYTRREQAEWLLQVMGEVWERFVLLYPTHLAAAAAASPEGAFQPMSDRSDPSRHQSWQQQLLADR